jgi:hypothetical protein
VVSAVALEVPDDALGASVWQLLSGTVSRRISSRPGTLAIADSKLLHQSAAGERRVYHLERGVLACLAVCGHDVLTLRGLLDTLDPDVVGHTEAYPWYRDLDLLLPTVVSADDLADAAGRLQRRMAAVGIRVLSIRSTVILAREFNREIERLGTKAAVNFAAAAPLLRQTRSLKPGQRTVIHVDRQGGRRYYRRLLEEVWPEAFVWIRDERADASLYTVEDGDGDLDIGFTVGCEQRQLPVALASMTSKYVRELLMERFNAYWTASLPGIAPTAGYVRDGRRFWTQVEPELRRLGLDADLVLRCR